MTADQTDMWSATSEPSTIRELVRNAARRDGSGPAVEEPQGKLLTYSDLEEDVTSLVGYLATQGVRREPGHIARIAIVLPNGAQMSVALLATTIAGMAVPFNPAYTEEEFSAYFELAEAAVLLTSTAAMPAAVAAAENLNIPVIDIDAAAGPTNRHDLAPPAPGDVAIMLLTSGTTGRGKLVPLTHKNLLTGTREVALSVAMSPSDRVLSMWELYHVGGIVDLLLAPLYSGGVVISAGGFEAGRFFELLSSMRPTWFQGVPTTLREIFLHANHETIAPAGSSLRFLRSVAAALPPAQMAELEALFGVPVIQTFGMTEAAPLITSTKLPPAVRKPGSTGSPCGTTVVILDPLGQPVETGETGEVAIGGDNVFSGYEANPEANAEIVSPWLVPYR